MFSFQVSHFCYWHLNITNQDHVDFLLFSSRVFVVLCLVCDPFLLASVGNTRIANLVIFAVLHQSVDNCTSLP